MLDPVAGARRRPRPTPPASSTSAARVTQWTATARPLAIGPPPCRRSADRAAAGRGRRRRASRDPARAAGPATPAGAGPPMSTTRTGKRGADGRRQQLGVGRLLDGRGVGDGGDAVARQLPPDGGEVEGHRRDPSPQPLVAAVDATGRPAAPSRSTRRRGGGVETDGGRRRAVQDPRRTGAVLHPHRTAAHGGVEPAPVDVAGHRLVVAGRRAASSPAGSAASAARRAATSWAPVRTTGGPAVADRRAAASASEVDVVVVQAGQRAPPPASSTARRHRRRPVRRPPATMRPPPISHVDPPTVHLGIAHDQLGSRLASVLAQCAAPGRGPGGPEAAPPVPSTTASTPAGGRRAGGRRGGATAAVRASATSSSHRPPAARCSTTATAPSRPVAGSATASAQKHGPAAVPRHEAAGDGGVVAEADPVGARPVAAVAGDRQPHPQAAGGGDGRHVDAELGQRPRPRRLDHHVGPLQPAAPARPRRPDASRSTATDSLPALSRSKKAPVPAGRRRDGRALSTFTTRAPARRSRLVHSGPAHSDDRSTTTRPASGRHRRRGRHHRRVPSDAPAARHRAPSRAPSTAGRGAGPAPRARPTGRAPDGLGDGRPRVVARRPSTSEPRRRARRRRRAERGHSASQPSAAGRRRVAPPALVSPWRVRPASAARSPSSAGPSTPHRPPRRAVGSQVAGPLRHRRRAGNAGGASSGGPSSRPVSAIAPEAAHKASVGGGWVHHGPP